MLVIRRLVDRHRAYTGIFLPGEPARIFPTTDYEHSRILQIYKQDKAYEGIVNDFSDDVWPALREAEAPAKPAESPESSPHPRKKAQPRPQHRQARQKRRP